MKKSTKSSRRVANCECAVCHSIVPKTEAVRREVERKSGRIGWGWSVSQRTDRSSGRRSFSSARDVYRTDVVWVCLDCVKDRSIEMQRDVPTAIVLIYLFAFVIGISEHGFLGVVDWLLTTGWGWVTMISFVGFVWVMMWAQRQAMTHFNEWDN